MGLTDGQEQTKIDKFKSIVVKKVYRKIQLLMTTMEKYQPLVVKWPNFRGWVVVWVRPHLNNRLSE